MDKDEMLELAREVVRTEADAVSRVADQFDKSLFRVVQTICGCRGHILVTGAGTSRAVAQRFAHLLACVGRPGLFISAADALHGGSGAVRRGDLLYVISKGGRSDEVNSFVRIARERGATVIAQTEDPDSPLARLSDLVLVVRTPREVDPHGMIATGSSLVNSAVTDAICVLALRITGYGLEDFARTHPGGAVGRKLRGSRQ